MPFRLAVRTDDAALRDLLRRSAMPGGIRVAYTREPDYFAGASVMATQAQTLVYETEGRIKAMACRKIIPMYINGEARDFGYLGGFRIDPAARNGIITGRGYRALRGLHADGRAPAYLSTIVSSNRFARGYLTSKRAGLPTYKDIGEYQVYTVLCKKRKPRPRGVDIVRGNRIPLHEIVSFLAENGSQRQFYPVYDVSDFSGPRTGGFRRDDFFVAVRNSRILGVVGAWDQSAYRQYRIDGYEGWIGLLRPLLNRLLRMRGFALLPEPGSSLRGCIVSFLGVRNQDTGVLRDLLDALHTHAVTGGYTAFSIGFHECDALRESVRSFPAVRYTSRMYLVYWEDGAQFAHTCSNGRVPHLEPATL
ncbi:MAG: hypothetical protein JW863_20825 [Chitinispirillaceae bacterium]|nr:hypothetical protein [Chitinispirillaceae bacterium]